MPALALQLDLVGDATVAFVGPCRVDLSEMVDIEDVKAAAPIYSPLMLHIIVEFFNGNPHQTIYRQRLLIVTAKELLETLTERPVTRRGDDLYLPRDDGSPGKLSVSIATSSATSTLIHTGFNIDTEGTPVPTVGLAELGVNAPAFADEVLRRYADEVNDIWLARCKVRAVSDRLQPACGRCDLGWPGAAWGGLLGRAGGLRAHPRLHPAAAHRLLLRLSIG